MKRLSIGLICLVALTACSSVGSVRKDVYPAPSQNAVETSVSEKPSAVHKTDGDDSINILKEVCKFLDMDPNKMQADNVQPNGYGVTVLFMSLKDPNAAQNGYYIYPNGTILLGDGGAYLGNWKTGLKFDDQGFYRWVEKNGYTWWHWKDTDVITDPNDQKTDKGVLHVNYTSGTIDLNGKPLGKIDELCGKSGCFANGDWSPPQAYMSLEWGGYEDEERAFNGNWKNDLPKIAKFLGVASKEIVNATSSKDNGSEYITLTIHRNKDSDGNTEMKVYPNGNISIFGAILGNWRSDNRYNSEGFELALTDIMSNSNAGTVTLTPPQTGEPYPIRITTYGSGTYSGTVGSITTSPDTDTFDVDGAPKGEISELCKQHGSCFSKKQGWSW